jgi:hypothetical protein
MSQWGKMFSVGRARFLPNVLTDAFQPIDAGSMIDCFMIVDNGGDADRAQRTLDDLQARYGGTSYGDFMRQQLGIPPAIKL